MIDPQLQANTWIRETEKNRQIQFLNINQNPNEVLLKLESSIQFGYPVMLENIGETIDSLYEPILQQKKVKQGSTWKLKMGEKTLDYSEDFKFYMTTKLPKPHYSPEICVKVTLLNFMVTLEGLEDQMLNIVVKAEEPSKDEQRQKNIRDFFENKNKQKITEDKILKMLSESKGEILDDEELIETLQRSKNDSIEIEDKLRKQVIYFHF